MTMRRPCPVAPSVCLALTLTCALAACGDGGQPSTSTLVGNSRKDSVVRPVAQIYESDDDEDWHQHWTSTQAPYSVMVDRDGDVVTDVELCCLDDGQRQALLEEWSDRYGDLSFAGVYDDGKAVLPSVDVCFFGLDDATRAREFVDAFDAVDFELSEDGLLHYETVGNALHGAGFLTSDESLEQLDKISNEIEEQLDGIDGKR